MSDKISNEVVVKYLRFLPQKSSIQSCLVPSEHWCGGIMDGRARRRSSSMGEGKRGDYGQLNGRRSFPASYFSVESLLVLICLTASLLILPLILPPLPPPPFMLLLLPIGILGLLVILAFMPSDVRNIASAYV